MMGTAASSANLSHGYPTPGPQSPDSQRVMDHIYFLSQSQWKAAREGGQYELIVIGSGFCGLAVAQRALERNPHCRILMLERGAYFLPEHFQNLLVPFEYTLSTLTETFPGTLSRTSALGLDGGFLRWQHGMVPFFGGRSILWSAWCPRPTTQEMDGWPAQTIAAAKRQFKAAEKLLHVQLADQVDSDLIGEGRSNVARQRPVYGPLQTCVQTLLENAPSTVAGIYRTQPAPIASDAKSVDGVDFQKFSTPAELLELVMSQRDLSISGQGATLDIAADCIVERIVHQSGTATALETTRGVLPIADAKLVLAMGSLPAATLVQNAYPDCHAGDRYAAHFATSIVARIPLKDLDPNDTFEGLQIGACYVAGKHNDYKHQFHIQLSCLSDPDPIKNSGIALRYMPDVMTTASMAQLLSSQGYVLYVCATLGEMSCDNSNTWFRNNPADHDPTTNSLLQLVESESDRRTWDAMDKATFEVLEQVLSPKGADKVEYWHGTPDRGNWSRDHPSKEQRRADAVVHDSSNLHIGTHKGAPVDLNYRLREADNIYVTGGALWPRAGSWNPTMTMVGLAMDLADKLVPKAT